MEDMSKWRPAPRDCIYVIPDIHGGYELLKLVCDRILPLRKSDGGKDRLVFLGDYIDRHADAHKVIDFLIEIEEKYGDQVTLLMGNHELMLLQAFNLVSGRNFSMQSRTAIFNMWLTNGGFETIAGYLERAGINESCLNFPRHRILDIIPKNHIKFMQRLVKGCEIEDWVFVHGGLNPLESYYNQELDALVWDRKLFQIVLEATQKELEIPWEKIIVTGHNLQADRKPIVTQKFLMLDCGSPKQLLVTELKSMEAYMAQVGKDRMVKYELEETVPAPPVRPSFRRADKE